MRTPRAVLLPIFAAATLLSAAEPGADTRSVILTWKDPGAFFPLEWGSNRVASKPAHCHSYPEQWLQECEFNAKIVDSLDVRLDIRDEDWKLLEHRAWRTDQAIKRCLHGRKVSEVSDCEGDSNIVSREFRDQYGGRWMVYAALGYPSEDRFDEPLWANAVLQRLGPLHVRIGAKGRLLAVRPPPRRKSMEARQIHQAMERGLKNLEQ